MALMVLSLARFRSQRIGRTSYLCQAIPVQTIRNHPCMRGGVETATNNENISFPDAKLCRQHARIARRIGIEFIT